MSLDATTKHYIGKMYPEGLTPLENELVERVNDRIEMAGGFLASRQVVAAVVETIREILDEV